MPDGTVDSLVPSLLKSTTQGATVCLLRLGTEVYS